MHTDDERASSPRGPGTSDRRDRRYIIAIEDAETRVTRLRAGF
jgi:hypothetical protein